MAVKEEHITTWEKFKDLSHGGGLGIIGLLYGAMEEEQDADNSPHLSLPLLLTCSVSSPPAPLHTCSPTPPTAPSASLCLQ